MSLRFILIAVAIWIAVILFRNYQAKRKINPPRGNKPIKNIVPCALCGTHIPENEALQDGDEFFCSAAHRDRAKK